MKHDNRILVVEDQKDLRAILRDLLSASGYSVIEAMDGAESVAKAALERPDLVLMDMQLPVLDGYDATRQIKALPALHAPRARGLRALHHQMGARGIERLASPIGTLHQVRAARARLCSTRAGRAATSDGSRSRRSTRQRKTELAGMSPSRRVFLVSGKKSLGPSGMA